MPRRSICCKPAREAAAASSAGRTKRCHWCVPRGSTPRTYSAPTIAKTKLFQVRSIVDASSNPPGATCCATVPRRLPRPARARPPRAPAPGRTTPRAPAPDRDRRAGSPPPRLATRHAAAPQPRCRGRHRCRPPAHRAAPAVRTATHHAADVEDAQSRQRLAIAAEVRGDSFEHVRLPQGVDDVQRSHRSAGVPPGGAESVEAFDLGSDGRHARVPPTCPRPPAAAWTAASSFIARSPCARRFWQRGRHRSPLPAAATLRRSRADDPARTSVAAPAKALQRPRRR